MKGRCFNKKNKMYKYYGARGITVCDRWKTFANFIEDMGQRPCSSLSLERIDNNKDYAPENCVWANAKAQNNNRRHCRLFTYDGKTMNMKQWSEYIGINYEALKERLSLNWKFEDAISVPTKKIRGQNFSGKFIRKENDIG